MRTRRFAAFDEGSPLLTVAPETIIRRPGELTFAVSAGEAFGAIFEPGDYTAREFAAHINATSDTHTAKVIDEKTVACPLRERSCNSRITFADRGRT